MNIRTFLPDRKRASFGFLAFLVIIASIALPALTPFIPQVAAAAPSKADMMIGGFYVEDDDDKYRNPTNFHWKMMSCQGSITRMTLTDDLIQRATRISDFSGLMREEDDDEAGARMFGGARYGKSGVLVGDTQKQYVRYLEANLNKEVQVVSWHKFSPASASSTESCGSEDPQGGHFILIPVHSRDGSTNPDSADTWLACEAWHSEKGRTAGGNTDRPRCKGTRFTAQTANADGTTTGTAEYYKTSIAPNNGMAFADGITQGGFTVKGISKPGPVLAGGNVTAGQFVDAATIKVTSNLGGAKITETYTDPAWDGKRYFFLTDSTNDTRRQMTFSARGGADGDDPINNTNARRSIPFIRLEGTGLNVNTVGGNTIASLGNGINTVNGGVLRYYDYGVGGGTICTDANGASIPCQNNGGLPTPVNISSKINRERGTVWFYGSPDSNALVPVFTTGDGNEVNYIGTYAFENDLKQYVVAGPGCDRIGLVAVDGGLPKSGVAYASWRIRPVNTNCIVTPGWDGALRVKVVADQASFDRINEASEDDAVLDENAEAGKVTCDASISSPLTWIMCPIASAATSAVEALDNVINSVLAINGDQYFGNTPTGNNLYAIFANLRTLAMGIIVVTGLFIVIAQASGWELISALTLRKALPSFVIAMLLLVAWWPIGRFLIQLGDVVTFGIRNLIYAPFGDIAVFKLDEASGTGGTSATLALLGSVYLLSLGVLATATLAVSALAAILIGCGLLVLRIGFIILGQTTASIFIPFKAIPNMQGVFNFFWGGFTKAIYVGPIISGAIAGARVLASILFTAAQGATGPTKYAFIIAAIFIYYGIYAALFELIQAVGGFFSTLAGRLNDSSRGVFDRMKNIRSKAPGDRWKKFKHGELWNDGLVLNSRRDNAFGKFSRFTGRMGERVNLGMKNNYGFGDKGKAAQFYHDEGHVDEHLRDNSALRSLTLNDDEATAVLGLSGGTEKGAREAIENINRGHVRAYMATHGVDQATAQAAVGDRIDAAEAQQIISRIAPFMNNRLNVMAASRATLQNKARAIAAGDFESIEAGADLLAEGNDYYASSQKSSLAYFGRANASRVDLGADPSAIHRSDSTYTATMAELKGTGATYQHAASMARMLDGNDRADIGGLLRSHTTTVQQAANTVQYLLDPKNKVSDNLRQEAALLGYEMTMGNNPQLNAANRKIINKMNESLGIDLNGLTKDTISSQYAVRVTTDKDAFNGQSIQNMGRVYASDMPMDQRNPQNNGGGP